MSALIGMLAEQDVDSFPAVFAVVERWHVEGDSFVAEAASVGLLEDLLVAASNPFGPWFAVLEENGQMPTSDDVNEWDDLGMTPLLYALFRGDVEGVRQLLEAGADPNRSQRDDPTATPLWHARDDFGLHEIAK